MIRLFLAVKIPDNVKTRIKEMREEIIQNDELHWEEDDKVHLTLKFIGDVKEGTADQIAHSLSFIEDFPRMKCSLTRFDFFFKSGKPRVLWVGLYVDSVLFQLVQEIENTLEKYKIPREIRPFKPHVTLLRVKRIAIKGFVKMFKEYVIRGVRFTATEVALMKSELNSEGATYTELKTYKLK